MRLLLGSIPILAFMLSGAMAQEAPPIDKSGKGAVLCAWMIYVEVRAASGFCEVPRTPWDDALDEAIADIEDFAVANSSQPMTHAQLRERADRQAEIMLELAQPSPEHRASFCESDWRLFRRGTAEELRLQVADMLSVPREPLLNPCF